MLLADSCQFTKSIRLSRLPVYLLHALQLAASVVLIGAIRFWFRGDGKAPTLPPVGAPRWY